MDLYLFYVCCGESWDAISRLANKERDMNDWRIDE
jgi:hypothetical protein